MGELGTVLDGMLIWTAETRDGKKSHDAGPHSEAMKKLNRQFGILHGFSSLSNVIGLGAMVWYAGTLAEIL